MNKNQFLSETLFHFWWHEPEELAFQTFTSIIERGLLLTRGIEDVIDRFRYLDKKGNPQSIEIVQNARVCFTDIPEHLSGDHSSQYGKCAVGFSRTTILEWGGCPVWYLPNHFASDTLQDQAS